MHTDAMKVLDRAIPVIHGGTPIPPDGRGCLLALENKDKGKQTLMVLMEWDGTQHPKGLRRNVAQRPKSRPLPVFHATNDRFHDPGH